MNILDMSAKKSNALSLLKANLKLSGTHLQELKNTAKTRGHPVTVLTPQPSRSNRTEERQTSSHKIYTDDQAEESIQVGKKPSTVHLRESEVTGKAN